MLNTRNLSSALPTYSLERNSVAQLRHRHFHNTSRAIERKPPAILVVAEQDLFLKLANYLSTQEYTVYAASEAFAAQAILANVPIDLVLFHTSTDMNAGAWEAYTELRHCTTKPILMISNITTEHFQESDDRVENPKKRKELTDYLKTIDLLRRTFIA